MRKILSAWGIIILMLVLIVGTVGAQTGDEPTPTPTATETATPTDEPTATATAEPSATPTSVPVQSKFYSHPVVQILSAYFGRTTRPMLPTAIPTETPTVDPLATATDVPSELPTATPTATPVMGPEELAQQIAMYHEQGIGFGVLVKLYAMAEESVQACLDQPVTGETLDPTQPACEAVTVDQLVGEIQGGAGMGQLFKEFGKPALLGVGQVKKALRNQQEEQLQSTPVPTLVPTIGSVDPQTLNPKLNGNSNKGNNNGNNNGNRPPKVKTPKPHGRNK
jgi:hypothetical protein